MRAPTSLIPPAGAVRRDMRRAPDELREAPLDFDAEAPMELDAEPPVGSDAATGLDVNTERGSAEVAFTLKQLKGYCREAGLPQKGNKLELMDRLIGTGVDILHLASASRPIIASDELALPTSTVQE